MWSRASANCSSPGVASRSVCLGIQSFFFFCTSVFLCFPCFGKLQLAWGSEQVFSPFFFFSVLLYFCISSSKIRAFLYFRNTYALQKRMCSICISSAYILQKYICSICISSAYALQKYICSICISSAYILQKYRNAHVFLQLMHYRNTEMHMYFCMLQKYRNTYAAYVFLYFCNMQECFLHFFRLHCP
jgi:hypothetical protein